MAKSLGISHRRLLGWEPTTTYAYDDAGRMIASRPEPEWDDAERSKMLALDLYEAGIGPCGHHHAETTDPENFFFDIRARKCPACRAKEIDDRIRAEQIRDWEKQKFGDKGAPASEPRPDDGVVTVVVRVPKEEAIARLEEAKAKGVAGGNQARTRRRKP